MAVGDIYKIAIVGGLPGNEMVVTLHYRMFQVQSGRDESQLAGDVAAIYGFGPLPAFRETFSAGISLFRLEVVNETNPVYGHVAPLTGGGNLLGQNLPLQTAPVIIKYSALRGRSYNGRNFLFPITETRQDSGVIDNVTKDFISAWIQDSFVITSITQETRLQWVVWSQKLQVATDIESVNINDKLGTMRSRQS